jgi:hypothetical protein
LEIGIFTSSRENSAGAPISFFGYDDEMLLAALYKAASTITGPGLERFDPEPGMRVKKVGQIVVAGVEDNAIYVVEADAATAKPATGRVPPGENGTWAIQSLIFSKDEFKLAAARKWVKDHAGFIDSGFEETSTSFRFRQYDPQYFSEYRTISVDKGISAAYGKISKDTEQDAEKSEKLLNASIEHWEAVHFVNKGIMTKGLKVLRDSVKITKSEDGKTEERFVLSLVLEPNDGQGGAPKKPDTQNDIYSEEDVRKACHAWMEFHGAVDLNHSWKDLGKERVRTLECYLAPVSFKIGDGEDAYEIVKGTWMLGIRVVDDALWKGVKDGELGAYSIGGTAVRSAVE